MIRKIRKKHKIVWVILAVLLPILFIAGILFWHNEPVNENVPQRMADR
jgi:thiosulfate reductase cytochrome b subunit